MRPIGIGVDVVEISRIQAAVERRPALIGRLFTETERRYAQGSSFPHVHYATRFAAKEAVAKALGSGLVGISWQDIEVVNNTSGRPLVRISGGAAQRAREIGAGEILLSLSSSKDHAAAVALAVAGNVPEMGDQ